MPRPPITAKSDRAARIQLEAALDYIEANGGGGSPAGSGSFTLDDGSATAGGVFVLDDGAA